MGYKGKGRNKSNSIGVAVSERQAVSGKPGQSKAPEVARRQEDAKRPVEPKKRPEKSGTFSTFTVSDPWEILNTLRLFNHKCNVNGICYWLVGGEKRATAFGNIKNMFEAIHVYFH